MEKFFPKLTQKDILEVQPAAWTHPQPNISTTSMSLFLRTLSSHSPLKMHFDHFIAAPEPMLLRLLWLFSKSLAKYALMINYWQFCHIQWKIQPEKSLFTVFIFRWAQLFSSTDSQPHAEDSVSYFFKCNAHWMFFLVDYQLLDGKNIFSRFAGKTKSRLASKIIHHFRSKMFGLSSWIQNVKPKLFALFNKTR